ncbi:arsenite efflux transporter metallochaperone ArsD [Pelagicoccus sp. SDUM812002]|uniref:arsenite efflux transporter metallochaperone ArsD n=1 Tax=Pelagicoccus sp. SDUM812002 TaxID=3041266 RepID=UPI00280E30C5|nr:arsenite efflux transporter metallochaperone ArsD [Pelagicoccus sp. SDUM812002]MDQ8188312.1 arsenite efflux transporter metallochaperone ArsD [Pelagicoccus sp. SDUM812002]
MNTIEVYDPALCCSTGVCGPTPDSELAAFASTLERLKAKAVSVTRHNLAQEPLAFAQNSEVKAILEKDSDSALPLVFINGSLYFRGTYPTPAQLEKVLGLPSEKAPLTFVKADAPKASMRQSCCDPSTGCC